MVSRIAAAKINLALHVRARRTDGYHELDTLFAFADQGDHLSAEAADALTLAIVGPFADGLSGDADNLVLRAAQALASHAGIARGAALSLDKRVPVASGIGGGSADAAATLRLLDTLWQTGASEADLMAIALTLGSDVPACLAGVTVRGGGRGEQLTSVDPGGLTGMPLLIVNPLIATPTGPVFAGWDGMDRGPIARGDPMAAALAGRNDLEPAAIALVPVIAELIDFLSIQPGVTLARMSGSGASVFALFDRRDSRDAAASAFAARYPDYWQLVGALT